MSRACRLFRRNLRLVAFWEFEPGSVHNEHFVENPDERKTQ